MAPKGFALVAPAPVLAPKAGGVVVGRVGANLLGADPHGFVWPAGAGAEALPITGAAFAAKLNDAVAPGAVAFELITDLPRAPGPTAAIVCGLDAFGSPMRATGWPTASFGGAAVLARDAFGTVFAALGGVLKLAC